MLRRKAPSHQVPCEKQHCCGASHDRQNYLSITSRGGSHSKKKRVVRKNKKRDSAKQLLQEHWEHLKDDNKNLQKKLAVKKKKIQELKLRIKVYETDIKAFQQKQEIWKNERERYHSSIHEDKPRKIKSESRDKASEIKFNKIIQDSQSVAKETLQRYKALQEEFSSYKQSAERKISKLKRQNHEIGSENTERVYNKQIEELKKDLNKFKQQQLTASSLKNLHQFASNDEKLRNEIGNLKQLIGELRNENEGLREYNQELEEELQDRKSLASHKEIELKNNLDVISNKVTNWQKEYRELKQECRQWQQQYNSLWDKYERKRLKYKKNNQEWAEIFKEFIEEIDKLKLQLETVSERNMKLIKMCDIK